MVFNNSSNIQQIIKNLSLTVNSTGSTWRQVTGPTWNFMAVFYLFVAICALSANGTVLLTFLCRRELSTAFNIYLINLLATNMLNVVLQNIPDIFNHLYSNWMLGNGVCSSMIFGLYVCEAAVQNCHALIAVNRIWAVFWPYSYRTRHTRPVALLLCFLGWAHVFATILPGYIRDELYFRTDPSATGCNLNIGAQWTWSVVVQFLVYDMGVFIMWVAYPIIWCRRRKTMKVSPTNLSSFGTARNLAVHPSGRLATADDKVEEEDEASNARLGHGRRQTSKAFMILTILTISVTICWTPIHAIYTYLMWMPLESVSPLLMTIAVILFSLQSILDPILFIWALPSLRGKFCRCIG